MNKQKDRLVELLDECCKTELCTQFYKSVLGRIADQLLANGVIVPPCKVGQDIYRVTGGKVYGDWQIAYIEVYPDEIGFIDDSDNYFTEDHIGKDVFLTREEALKALGGVQG